MATFPSNFRTDSRQIHADHQALATELLHLDSALDQLGEGVLSQLDTAEDVARCGHRLAELLPEHFRREETLLFGTVAQVSPELREFSREMRHQHDLLRQRLIEFHNALEQMSHGKDVGTAVEHVRETGRLLAKEMSEHMAVEEDQLDGFL
jgi:hemerythrin-like domain-containing protein